MNPPKKKRLTKKVSQYIAIFEEDPEGGYVVSIPNLPGCLSQGDTFEDAMKNIEEAAGLYLETMRPAARRRQFGTIVAPVKVLA